MKQCALRAAVALTLSGLWASTVRADAYDPDPSYYATATATAAAALKSQLQSIVTHSSTYKSGTTTVTVPIRSISYSNIGDALVSLDQDPNNPNNVQLIYNKGSALKSNVQSSGTAGWNKEHIFPASLLGGDGAAGYSDEFNLRPAQPQLNGSRGNLTYAGTNDTAAVYNGQFSPGVYDRGDVARAVFFMATRYSNGTSTPGENNLQVINNTSGTVPTYYMGDLASLLRYHYQDLPDTYERRRNSLAYTGLGTLSQGNRNPYIDHPEYVWAVFGGGVNDSQITVNAGVTAGASTKAVTFTPVIVGGAVGSLTQSVAISKTGIDPTTFAVTAAGAATSSIGGVYNAFNYNATAGAVATQSITVGLNASSATAGLKTGSVTVDNTDLTTAGAGTGSADGDDTINVSLNVLDHSNASFSNAADADALTLDFKNVDLGTKATLPFGLYNLFANGTLTTTAGLDLDSVTPSGSGPFGTSLATFLNLAGGAGSGYTASFMPTTVGSFTMVYTLGVSDQDLAGATSGTSLTLTLTGTAVPEPATLSAVGVAGVVLLRRRRPA